MEIFFNCTDCITRCLETKRFAGATLVPNEETKKIHNHDCHEIYYSLSGCTNFFIEGKYYDISPGDIVFIERHKNHFASKVTPGEHKRINLAIHPDFLEHYSTPETNLAACFENHNLYSPHIHLDSSLQKKLMSQLRKLYYIEGYGKEIIENSLFCNILVMLNAEFFQQNVQHSRIHEEQELMPKSNALFAKILNYVDANIAHNITLEELSSTFYVSQSYICRLFKNQTGMSFKKYISIRRINLAKDLIYQGILLSDIYLAVGFSNYNTFYKTFVSITGVSPKEYLNSQYYK